MRKSIFAALSVVALTVALPAAAQQPDRDRRGEDTQYRDRDRENDEFRNRDRNGASQGELAAADRRLNQIYQRRIVEARAADRAYGRRSGDDRYDRDREGRPDDRYGRTAEWLTVLSRLWTEKRVDFEGQYYTLQDAIVEPKPTSSPERPRPVIYAGGLENHPQIVERSSGKKPAALSRAFRPAAHRPQPSGPHQPSADRGESRPRFIGGPRDTH